MKKPILAVREYRHSKYKFQLDLRAFGRGRKFFKTRTEADAECLRQKTLLERHSRAALGLSQREMSEVIPARDKLAEYGKRNSEATVLFVDHLERIRRCKTTAPQLAADALAVKRKDGHTRSRTSGRVRNQGEIRIALAW